MIETSRMYDNVMELCTWYRLSESTNMSWSCELGKGYLKVPRCNGAVDMIESSRVYVVMELCTW